jgi:hypothetical protein
MNTFTHKQRTFSRVYKKFFTRCDVDFFVTCLTESYMKIYFDNDEYANLAYLQLGQQCEVLIIKIKNRINIFDH